MSDLRPPLGAALAAFGLPATVTLPGEEPVDTTAIWLGPVLVEVEGVLVQTSGPQAVLALPRTDVPTVPRGTLIEAAEIDGGPVRSWSVEAVHAMTVDEVRLIVIPAEV